MKTHLLILPLAALFAGPFLALGGEQSTGAANANLSGPLQSQENIEDLGEIKEAPEGAVKFRASASGLSTLTSNAKLSGNHGSGDVLFFPTLSGGLNKPLGKQFSFDLEAKLESALYSRFDERSFAGYSAIATLDWRPRPSSPRLFIGAEPYRYDSYDTGDLISEAIGLSVGTDWGYAFNRGNSIAFAGYTFTDYLADPNIDTRLTNRLVLGITHQIKPQLYGQLLYTFQHSDFENIDRRDLRHIASLSFVYQFNTHLFGNASASFVDSNSTQAQASYQSSGLSVGLTWQF